MEVGRRRTRLIKREETRGGTSNEAITQLDSCLCRWASPGRGLWARTISLVLGPDAEEKSGSDAGPGWAAGTAAAAVRDYRKIVVSKVQGARYAYVDTETNDSLVD